MRVSTRHDLSQPTRNAITRHEPDEILIQPDDPDDHFIDGEDEADWSDDESEIFSRD